MTQNTMDWNELLFNAQDSDTILTASGHLVYLELFDKECPQSESPNNIILAAWLQDIVRRDTFICPVLGRTLNSQTAHWCVRLNGETEEVGARRTQRSKVVGIADIHAKWRTQWEEWEEDNIKEADEVPPGHPIMALLRKWYDRSRGLDESKLYVSKDRFVQGFTPVAFVGQGVFRRKNEVSVSLRESLLPVARVDGEPIATKDPFSDGQQKCFYTPMPSVHQKKPYRNTLFDLDEENGIEVKASNVILGTLANQSLQAPKNAHLRTDIYKIGAFCFLFPHRVNISFTDAKRIIMGHKSRKQLQKERVNQAINVLKGIQFLVHHQNVPISVPLISYDVDVTGNEPIFILGRGESFRRQVAPGYMALAPQWTLSGVFTRKMNSKSGGIERLINGLEMVLANSRFNKKGPRRRFSEFLEPADRKTTGPGKPMMLTWEEMMFTAGEFIGDSDLERRRAYQNWNKWMLNLQKNGYFCKDGKEAEAYDTIEIVSRIRASRYQQAGALIRASSRFTEAVRLQQQGKMETMTATEFLNSTLKP